MTIAPLSIRARAELEYRRRKKLKTPLYYWQPQPKQEVLLEACGLDDALRGGVVHPPMCETIGYGGAAFGGKTEGMIGIGLIACLMIPGVQVGFFRRKFSELEGSDGPIYRTLDLYKRAGGHYNQQQHNWTFPHQANFHFCHCQHEKDVYNYQSQAFDILLIDEATHFSWFIIDYLITRNRPSKNCSTPIFRVMGSNPGNIGHSWYRKLYGITTERMALNATSD